MQNHAKKSRTSPPELEAPVHPLLQKAKNRDLALLAKLGVWGTTALISLAIISISGAITFSVVTWMGHPLIPDMFLGLGIPVLLGPPVAYLMARFQQLYRAAESASQTKSDFLSNMSHDLGSPLHGIISLTDVLLEDPEIQKRFGGEISAIHVSSQHLLELIDDILNYGKLEAGVMSGYVENFDLSNMLYKLIGLYKVRCNVKGLALHLEISSDVPLYVRGDQQMLFQVLVNLVGNALKFTHQGSIRVGVTASDEHVCIQVKDTGPGIAPEDQERIFEPFIRTSATVSKTGTGLGLAIACRYVKMLKGVMTLESQPGQGSIFRVRVPLPPVVMESSRA